MLELLSRCYRSLGRWQALQEILPVMQKAGLIDGTGAQSLKHQAGALAEAVSVFRLARDGS